MDRAGSRAPEAAIKHIIIDVTRVNLRYRGFTGKREIGPRTLPAAVDLCEVSWQRDHPAAAIATLI